tara:strand:+ start:1138 stop:1458 length:321 start_codon:yes stop_codon:yes gene_type:complete
MDIRDTELGTLDCRRVGCALNMFVLDKDTLWGLTVEAQLEIYETILVAIVVRRQLYSYAEYGRVYRSIIFDNLTRCIRAWDEAHGHIHNWRIFSPFYYLETLSQAT